MKKQTAVAIAALALTAGAGTAAAAAQYGDYGDSTTSTTPATTVVKPTTVKLGHTRLGTYLVSSSGRALYLFERDTRNKSHCSGSCVKAWPPLITSITPRAGKGVHKSLLGTTKRSDGRLQVTYNGHPLYRYDDDKAAGQHHGQGLKEFGAKWYVVRSSGRKLDKG